MLINWRVSLLNLSAESISIVVEVIELLLLAVEEKLEEDDDLTRTHPSTFPPNNKFLIVDSREGYNGTKSISIFRSKSTIAT